MSDELHYRYRKGWRSLRAGRQIPIGSHLCYYRSPSRSYHTVRRIAGFHYKQPNNVPRS